MTFIDTIDPDRQHPLVLNTLLGPRDGATYCKCKLYHGENQALIQESKLSQKLNAVRLVCGSPGSCDKLDHDKICIYVLEISQ